MKFVPIGCVGAVRNNTSILYIELIRLIRFIQTHVQYKCFFFVIVFVEKKIDTSKYFRIHQMGILSLQ